MQIATILSSVPFALLLVSWFLEIPGSSGNPQPSSPASSPQADLGNNLIQQIANQFVTTATQVLQAIDTSVIQVSRAVFVTLLLLGLFLYFTRLHRRLGKELIIGGIAIAILSQIVVPLVKI